MDKKMRTAVGALLLTVGLVMCIFGAAYTATRFALRGSAPDLAWVLIGMGALALLSGIYTFVTGIVKESML